MPVTCHHIRNGGERLKTRKGGLLRVIWWGGSRVLVLIRQDALAHQLGTLWLQR